jgi:hypothetical protein
MRGIMIAVVMVLLGSCATEPPLPTTTETLTWEFKSMHPNIVQLEFYSQNRNAAWPGGDRAYEIRDWQWHTYRITCRTGEKICYGAWVAGDETTYWGVGLNDRHGCQGCCRTCATAHAGRITLDP